MSVLSMLMALSRLPGLPALCHSQPVYGLNGGERFAGAVRSMFLTCSAKFFQPQSFSCVFHPRSIRSQLWAGGFERALQRVSFLE